MDLAMVPAITARYDKQTFRPPFSCCVFLHNTHSPDCRRTFFASFTCESEAVVGWESTAVVRAQSRSPFERWTLFENVHPPYHARLSERGTMNNKTLCSEPQLIAYMRFKAYSIYAF